MSHENAPLVLPGWLNPSEVSYIRSRVGVVTHRGETTRETRDIRCPNEPRCTHPAFVHDIDTYEDPRPICCADGCSCGKPSGGAQ